jgi:hypothetical protein
LFTTRKIGWAVPGTGVSGGRVSGEGVVTGDAWAVGNVENWKGWFEGSGTKDGAAVEAGTGVPNAEPPNEEPPNIDWAIPDDRGTSGNPAGTSDSGAGATGNGLPPNGNSGSNNGGAAVTASGPREFCEFKKAGLKGPKPGGGWSAGPKGPNGPRVTGSNTNPGTAGTVPGNVIKSGKIVTGDPDGGPAGELRKSGANDNDGVGWGGKTPGIGVGPRAGETANPWETGSWAKFPGTKAGPGVGWGNPDLTPSGTAGTAGKNVGGDTVGGLTVLISGAGGVVGALVLGGVVLRVSK